MSTCVVTGGAGFLGSHLCEHLLGEGHRVICIDNLDTGSLQNIEHIRDPRSSSATSTSPSTSTFREDVDFVYHLASPASPIDYLRLPLDTLKVGSHGTHHMLGVAKFKRARFLIASTSEVYGDPQVHPQTEDYWGHVNPIGPRGVYDEAKRYAEALTMAYHRQQGVDTRSSASSTPTARGCGRTTAGRSRPSCARRSRTSRSRCSATAARPAASATSTTWSMASSPSPSPTSHAGQHRQPRRVHAAGAGEDRGRGDRVALGDRLRAAAGRRSEQRQPDITRARDLLGWEPQVELREGLRRTIEQTGMERLVGASD